MNFQWPAEVHGMTVIRIRLIICAGAADSAESLLTTDSYLYVENTILRSMIPKQRLNLNDSQANGGQRHYLTQIGNIFICIAAVNQIKTTRLLFTIVTVIYPG